MIPANPDVPVANLTMIHARNMDISAEALIMDVMKFLVVFVKQLTQSAPYLWVKEELAILPVALPLEHAIHLDILVEVL